METLFSPCFSVISADRFKIVREFMSCQFENYFDMISSPNARSFVFRLPDPSIDIRSNQMYYL